jgi:two-component sensor histidine kinase
MKLSEELMVPLVNFWLYAVLTPSVFWLSMRCPIQQDNWLRRGPQYFVAALAYSWVHVGVRGMIYPVWDLRINAFAYAAWNPHTGVWKFDWILYRNLLLYNSLDSILVGFVPIVLIAHAVVYHRRFREREFQASQLETQLAKARLQTLKSQLQPHFLFNTMHSISSLMLTDVPAADRMMTRLSDLLRMSLEKDGVQITPLSCELDFVNGYLEIEKIRFEDRLRVSVEVAPDALDAQVPHLILQPLVENAVKHGISRRSQGGEIGIVATHDERNLYLRVSDNGPGMNESSPEEKAGLGLRATRERLQALYGDQQSIEIVEGREGGVEVRVRIPFRTEARPL